MISCENRNYILFKDLGIYGVLYYISLNTYYISLNAFSHPAWSIKFLNTAYGLLIITTLIMLIEHQYYLHKLNKSKINQFE